MFKKSKQFLFIFSFFFLFSFIFFHISCSIKEYDFQQKVLLFGIDGGEWKIVQPLMKMGYLPTFKYIHDSGSFGPLFSPTQSSPVEWTSIATGKNYKKHGIINFLTMSKNKNQPLKVNVMTRNDRKVKAIWNILSEKGFSVAIFGWWATWPAERVNGIMLTDAYIYRNKLKNSLYPLSLKTYFSNIAVEAASKTRRWLLENVPDIDKVNSRTGKPDIRTLSGQIETFEQQLTFDFIKKNSALAARNEFDTDFVGLYLRTSDLASHFFYKDAFLKFGERNWQPDSIDRKRFGMVIPLVYSLYDKFLMELLDSYKTRPSVLIVSDHGFGPGKFKKRFNIKFFIEKANLTLDEMLLNKVFTYKTKSNSVYVKNSFEFNETKKKPNFNEQIILLKKLKSTLSSIKTINGKSLFLSLKLSPSQNKLITKPYLITIPNKAVSLLDMLQFPQGAVYAFHFFSYRKWSGSHRPYGLAFFNGPPFKQTKSIHTKMTTWDICPSILNLFHCPRAEDMDGKIITEALKPDFFRKYPPQLVIPTYEDKKTHFNDASETLDKNTKDKIINELKTIGYI